MTQAGQSESFPEIAKTGAESNTYEYTAISLHTAQYEETCLQRCIAQTARGRESVFMAFESFILVIEIPRAGLITAFLKGLILYWLWEFHWYLAITSSLLLSF